MGEDKVAIEKTLYCDYYRESKIRALEASLGKLRYSREKIDAVGGG